MQYSCIATSNLPLSAIVPARGTLHACKYKLQLLYKPALSDLAP